MVSAIKASAFICASRSISSEEKSKDILDDAQELARETRREIKDIENIKDNLLQELKNLANDTLEKIQRLNKNTKNTQEKIPAAPLFETAPTTPPTLASAVKPVLVEEKPAPLVLKTEEPTPVVKSLQDDNIQKSPTRAYLESLKNEEPAKENPKTEHSESDSFFDQFK